MRSWAGPNSSLGCSAVSLGAAVLSVGAAVPTTSCSEPGGRHHFARTGDGPVVVQISGLGPTDTRYFDPANAPKGRGE